LSQEVVANIGEIGMGLNEITRAVGQVSDLSRSVGQSSLALDEAVHRYQI